MIRRNGLLVALVVVGLATLAVEAQDAAEQKASLEEAERLRALRELAAEADNRALSALLSRVERSYDPLVDTFAALEAASRALDDNPHLTPFRARLAVTRQRIELLKRYRAGLQNAQLYLAEELAGPAPEPANARIQRELALFLMNPDRERQLALREAALAVAESAWEDLDRLGKHIGILVEARRRLDNLARELLVEDLGGPAALAVEHQKEAAARSVADHQRRRVLLLALMVLIALTEVVRRTRTA